MTRDDAAWHIAAAAVRLHVPARQQLGYSAWPCSPIALCPPCDQANTALAETPGSAFTGECEALLREERYGDLLDKFVQHLDLVLSKSTSDQGGRWRWQGPGLGSAGVGAAASKLHSALSLVQRGWQPSCLP